MCFIIYILDSFLCTWQSYKGITFHFFILRDAATESERMLWFPFTCLLAIFLVRIMWQHIKRTLLKKCNCYIHSCLYSWQLIRIKSSEKYRRRLILENLIYNFTNIYSFLTKNIATYRVKTVNLNRRTFWIRSTFPKKSMINLLKKYLYAIVFTLQTVVFLRVPFLRHAYVQIHAEEFAVK